MCFWQQAWQRLGCAALFSSTAETSFPTTGPGNAPMRAGAGGRFPGGQRELGSSPHPRAPLPTRTSRRVHPAHAAPAAPGSQARGALARGPTEEFAPASEPRGASSPLCPASLPRGSGGGAGGPGRPLPCAWGAQSRPPSQASAGWVAEAPGLWDSPPARKAPLRPPGLPGRRV